MVLFVCSLGQLRSRTAELLCLFGGMDARCCGTDKKALYPANDNLLRTASLVVCMEAAHKKALSEFQHYGQCDVVTLGVRDVYNRLDPLLVRALIYQVGFHSKEVAAAMERGASVLASLPGYQEMLGTSGTEYANNDAYGLLPN